MGVRTLVADDDPQTMAQLTRWVQNDARLRLVGVATNEEDALAMSVSRSVDLAFFGIQQPGLNGLALLRSLRARQVYPFVVLVSGCNQHAVEAFDQQAGDFLLKPLQEARFSLSVERTLRAITQRSTMQSIQQSHNAILFRDGMQVTPVAPSDIVWVEAASQYARVHTLSNDLLLSRPLASVESQLPITLFLRVHRSALVNVAHILHLKNRRGRLFLEMTGKQQIPVARARRKEVLAQVQASRLIN